MALAKDEKMAFPVAVLCGGRGTRLKPITDTVPKALVKLNGRPILDHVLDFYQLKGFHHFLLCVGYKADVVKAHYKVPPKGAKIAFSDSGESASMLQRIWALRDQFDDHLLVAYGDTFIDLDLNDMLDLHLSRDANATIVTAKIRNPFGLVTSDSMGWVTSFVEKPLLNYYIGSFILKRSALDHVTQDMLQKPDGQGLVEFFQTLMERQKLACFEHKGLQTTFNTESERQKAEEDMGKFYTYSEGP